MDSRQLYALLVLSVVTILATTQQAFADTEITISKGDSAGPDCATAKNCYNPDVATVAPGDTVTWTNADSVSHTVTSGNPSDNQTGTIFDSSLIRPTSTYSFTFKDAGMYNYFCEVHPWMTGQVIVAAATSNTSNSTPTTSMQSSGSSMSNMQSSGVASITITPGAAALTSCEQTSTCFGPNILYVTPGTVVTWENSDIVSHDVIYGSPETQSSVTTMFDSNVITPGQTFTYQFNHPGIYPYYDKSYQWETGLIIVKASY
ncbi:MAG: plastocyanin/azurin family copper-binding protein [Nitrosotalea sp.]